MSYAIRDGPGYCRTSRYAYGIRYYSDWSLWLPAGSNYILLKLFLGDCEYETRKSSVPFRGSIGDRSAMTPRCMTSEGQLALST